jgi:hypothetical protein
MSVPYWSRDPRGGLAVCAVPVLCREELPCRPAGCVARVDMGPPIVRLVSVGRRAADLSRAGTSRLVSMGKFLSRPLGTVSWALAHGGGVLAERAGSRRVPVLCRTTLMVRPAWCLARVDMGPPIAHLVALARRATGPPRGGMSRATRIGGFSSRPSGTVSQVRAAGGHVRAWLLPDDRAGSRRVLRQL